MHKSLSFALAAVAAAVLGGCESRVEIPKDAQITCSSAEPACPTGWSCATAVGRCVPIEELDAAPPAFAVQPTLIPTQLKDGAVATLSFTVNEVLLSEPTVELVLAAETRRFALDAAASSGTSYVFTYTATGLEQDQVDAQVRVVLVDRVGNQSSPLPGGTLRFDSVAPKVTQASFDKAWLKAGETATLTVVVDELLPAAPLARFEGGAELAFVPAGSTGTTYRYAYTAAGDEASLRTVELAMADAAGNSTTAPGAAQLRFDFVPPTLLAPVELTPRNVRLGDWMTLGFDLSEAATVTTTIRPVGSAAPIVLTNVGSGTRYEYAFNVSTLTGEGVAPIAIHVEDAAGHVLEVGESLNVDKTTPSPSALVATPPGPYRSMSSASPAQTISLSFTSSEPLSAAAGEVSGQVGSTPISCANQTATTFVCTLPWPVDQPPENSGPQPLALTLRDAANNAQTVNPTSLVFDYAAPELRSFTFSGSDLSTGDTAVVAFTASEALTGAPEVSVATSNGVLTFTRDPTVTAPSYRYTYQAQGSEPQDPGGAPLTVVLTDLAGNASTLGTGEVVRFDYTAPLLTVTGATGLAREGTALRFELQADEPLAAAPQLTLEFTGGAQTTLEGLPSGGKYIYLHTVGAADPEGPTSISVSAADRAGNPAGLSQPAVTIDLTAPQTTGVGLSSPGPFRSSDATTTVSYSVNFDTSEPVVPAKVSVTLAGRDDLFTCLPLDGTNTRFECTHEVAQGLTGTRDGTFPVYVELWDAAGNVTAVKTGLEVTYDFELPVVRAESLSYGILKSGRVTVLELSSPDLLVSPTVTLSPSSVGWTFAGSSGDRYTFSYQATGTESTASPSDIVVTTADEAGNSITATVGQLSFDFTAPQPVAGTFTVTPGYARAGSTVLASVTADEDLDLAAAFGTFNGGPMIGGAAAGSLRELDYSYLLSTGVLDGNATTVVRLQDPAGNFTDLTDSTVVVDNVAPTITAVSLPPGPYRSGTTAAPVLITATVAVSETVSDLKVLVGERQEQMSCVPSGGFNPNEFECTLRTPLDQTDLGHALDGKTDSVVAHASDPAGNSLSQSLGVVSYDFTRPGINWATRENLPKSTCLLPAGYTGPNSTAGLASEVNVTLSPNDALFASPPVWPELRAYHTTDPAAEVLYFNGPFGSITDSTFSFDKALPFSVTSGVYQLRARLVDDAGNESLHTDGTPFIPIGQNLIVDADPPVLGDAELAQLVYRRKPWGDQADPGNASYTIEALTPGAVEANVYLMVYDGPFAVSDPFLINGTATVLATMRVDRPQLHIRLIDQACNESAYRKVRNVDWVITAGKKVAGVDFDNPNSFAERRLFGGTLEDDDLLLGRDKLQDEQETPAPPHVTVNPAGFFRQYRIGAPPMREGGAMAFDNGRGRAIHFGGVHRGFGQTLLVSDQLWEWDGSKLVQRFPTDPEGDGNPSPRSGASMVFDSLRARLILFGGRGGETASAQLYDDLWEYDGISWRRLSPTGPPSARYDAAMAYDPVRRKVVLFGGVSKLGVLDDTWEYSPPLLGATGSGSWTSPTPTARPQPRKGHALLYDSIQQRLLLVGGATTGDVLPTDAFAWSFDTPPSGNPTWSAYTGVAEPPGRQYHGAAFETVNGEVIITGGLDAASSALADAWRWLPGTAAWTSMQGPPAPRYRHSLVYDIARDVLFSYGGDVGGNSTNDLWEFNRVRNRWIHYTPQGSASQWPSPRRQAAMAYLQVSANQGQSVLFGGADSFVDASGAQVTTYSNEVWAHDGEKWNPLFGAQPGTMTPRRGSAMAGTDPSAAVTQRVLVFGGETAPGVYSNELFQMTAASHPNWTQVVPGGTAPAARTEAAMAYDSLRDRFYVYGGAQTPDGGIAINQFSVLHPGNLWQTLSSGFAGVRRRAALAYDKDRDRLVLFGGISMTTRWGSTFEYDAVTNTWTAASVPDPEGDGNPTARDGHALWYDPSRRKMILYGGDDGSPSGEVWEYNVNGTSRSWRRIKTADPFSDGRPSGRTQLAAAFNFERGRALLFGGITSYGFDSEVQESWEYDSGARKKMAYVAQAYLSESGLSHLNLDRVGVRVSAGGEAFPAGTSKVGFDTFLWEEGRWQPGPVSTTGTPNACVPLTASFPGALDPPERLRRMLYGPRQTLALAVAPSGINGSGDAALSLDYVEITARYLLDP